MSLPDFLIEHRDDMLRYITDVVTDLKERMQLEPDAYTYPGDSEPSVDLRLCVDHEGDGHGQWQVFVGDSAYDQVHYELCGAGSVTLDTKPVELLNDLIDQILEQGGI